MTAENSLCVLYLKQARVDWESYRSLNRSGTPDSQWLHMLQMTTEKLGKAYLAAAGDTLEDLKRSHSAFCKCLRTLPRNKYIIGVVPFTSPNQFKLSIDGLLPIAEEVERLAPAIAQNGPNAEYPWRDKSGVFQVACEFNFPVVSSLGTSKGQSLLKLVRQMLYDLPEYFGISGASRLSVFAANLMTTQATFTKILLRLLSKFRIRKSVPTFGSKTDLIDGSSMFFHVLNINNKKLRDIVFGVKILAQGRLSKPPHITVRGPFDCADENSRLADLNDYLLNNEVTIDGVDQFVNGENHVVYLKCSSPALNKIWYKPSYPAEKFGINPHITIYDGPDKEFANRLYSAVRKKLEISISFVADRLEILGMGIAFTKQQEDALRTFCSADEIIEIMNDGEISLSKDERIQKIEMLLEKMADEFGPPLNVPIFTPGDRVSYK